MNISYGGRSLTIEAAIEHKLTPSAYSYDGKLEKLEKKIELQGELIGRLIACLYGEESVRLTKHPQMEFLLGYEYEVE